MSIKLKQPTALTVVAKRGPIKTTYPPGHFDPFYMEAAPYEHANLLGEAPNVSHRPRTIERVLGAIVILTVFGFCWALYMLWKLTWRVM